MKTKNGKVVKYKKRININIGMIVFGIIFVYVLIYVVMYLRTTHIVRYEVREGSLATENIYCGIILRDETVINTKTAGYVNYYAREGERVAKNSLVFVMDETGRLSENLDSMNQGENTLSNKELQEFRNEIVNFVHEFDEVDYDVTYDYKYSLKNTILKLANTNMMDSVSELNGVSGVNIINYDYAPKTGIVSYWTDGYENLNPTDITNDILTKKDYEKKQLITNSLLANDSPAYKLSTSEDWSIVIAMDDSVRAAQLVEKQYVKVRFLKNQYESWAQVVLLNNPDGNIYIQLLFNNSMISFINDRYLDIELILEDETGLKIPVTSIVQKEFYLIPEHFVDMAGNLGNGNIMRQCYMEDGTISSEVLDIEVYNYDANTCEYYVDSSILNAGDVLYNILDAETYTVSKRATLIGVYNMNKGYADFKQINILYQNEEYAIVKSNTKYGLNVYDYIVLNAESVVDDQFIN